MKEFCQKALDKQKFGLIVDGKDYFKVFKNALLQAEERVMIVGWDLHTKVHLEREEKPWPSLTDVLQEALKRNPKLHVYFLIWEYSPIYFLERELFQKLKLSRRFLKRVHFHYDSCHPIGGSQHQKIAIFDDIIGFCGGIDLTMNRWDQQDHRYKEKARVNPTGSDYQPFHDIQSMVVGQAVKPLVQVCCERWRRVTGEELPELSSRPDEDRALAFLASQEDSLASLFSDAKLDLKLTFPQYKSWPEVRTVEESLGDLIATAKNYIYFENQYFTSKYITEALGKRLQEPDGPEIVMVLPAKAESFVERNSMAILQSHCIKTLQEQDSYGKFMVCAPVDSRLPKDRIIKVHSKLTVIDDTVIQIGSANLNNRSMGLDSECDWRVELSDEFDQQKLRAFVAHELTHFSDSKDSEKALETWNSSKSLHEAVRGLQQVSENQYLKELDDVKQDDPELEGLVDKGLLDWDQPLKFEQIIDRTAYSDHDPSGSIFRGTSIRILTLLVMGVALAATLFYLDLDLVKFQDWLRSELNLASSSGWQGTLLAVAIFAISAMLFVPVNLLILAFASIFHGYEAVTYILCGVLGAAAGGYVMGQLLSHKILHRMLPEKLLTIGEKIKGRHILPLILVRLTPVAPFSLVNIAAGSVKVHFGIYILGTALGILPGTVSLVFFQNSLFDLISEPSAENIALFVGSVLVVLGIFYGLNQRFSQKDQNISEENAHA